MYKNIDLNEFWENGLYWHLDICIHGLAMPSGTGAVRFKLFGFKNGHGLEFRQLDGWPRAFESWPGVLSDEYGDVFRLHANLALDPAIFSTQDAAMMRSLAAALPSAVAEATAGLADRPESHEAANRVATTIFVELGYPSIPFATPESRSDVSAVEVISAPLKPAPIESPLPRYVQEILAAAATAELTCLKKSCRPLPDRWTPIAVCVVKDEYSRLPDFLRHYREAGVERFCFIDNGSTDSTRNYLLAQPDADVYVQADRFSWIEKQAWISHALRQYGLDRWFIYADADEHIVFQDMAVHALSDVTRAMQAMGISRVRGFLIDMYADCALTRSAYAAPGRLSEAYPFFDSNTYMEEIKDDIISVRGGPRARVFGDVDPLFRPEMTKYPLFLSRDGDLMANPHHHFPYEANFASERYLAILHYKFLPDVLERIEKAVESGAYWENSLEYRCYQSVIRSNPEISLMGEMSARYAGPGSLVSLDLIKRIPWQGENRLAAIYSGALRRRGAELECAQGALLHKAAG